MQSTIRQLFKKRAIALAAVALIGSHSFNAYAVEAFKLKNIHVEGLKHADAGTVFASLPFKIGDTYDDDAGIRAIQSLYATGLFNDVKLSVQGDVLVIAVQERPVISSLTFSGAKAFSNEILIGALRGVGISEGRPFDKALADQAEQELKRQYLSQGYYSAEVEITTTPIDNNRVNVAFSIKEGDIAKIAEIRIIGNQDFSDSRLKKELAISSGNWLSWYTKNNRYSRERLNADLEKLRSFYLNKGYLDFHFNSTQV
ncbi:MAG: POTRA domain-containing protein, partial [Saezia sp.]